MSSSNKSELAFYAAQRENARRGIFLTREIDWDLYEKLLPEIIRLRNESSEAICLFIDSSGGRTDAAGELVKQIRTPNQDGERCPLTTVNVGTAASAAADLLAAGDYAIAYSGSTVLCHGTRHLRPQITLEDVPLVAENIKAHNEKFALRLATAMFRRLVFLAAMMSANGESQKDLIKSVTTDPVSLLKKIKENLKEKNQQIIDLALERQRKIQEIIAHIDRKFKKRKKALSVIKTEGEILKNIVDYEIKENLSRSGHILSDHLSIIQDDFSQIKDYFNGQYRKRLTRTAIQFGEMFLEKEEQDLFEKIQSKNKKEIEKFLVEKAAPKLFPFWYLVVSICRILQEGEYTFTASESLWFGLVDEAIGTNLPSLRKFREQKEKEKPTLPSSNAPEPPFSQSLPSSEKKD